MYKLTRIRWNDLIIASRPRFRFVLREIVRKLPELIIIRALLKIFARAGRRFVRDGSRTPVILNIRPFAACNFIDLLAVV